MPKGFIFSIIVIIQALGQVLADMYLPSFPAIASAFKTPMQNVELTLTIYAFGYGISQLIYGPISDGYGRRKPMVVGLFLCSLGSLICFVAPNIETLLLGRLCQALGAGATLAVGTAILHDLFLGPTLSKYMSYAGVVFVVSLALAPLLGGYIQTYLGWRAIFALTTMLSILAFIVFIFKIPETNQHLNRENLRYPILKQNIRTLLSSPFFIGYASCSLLTYGAILAWITAGPILLEEVVGLSPIEYGWVYVATSVAFAVGAFSNSKLVSRFDMNMILQSGLVLMLIAGLTMLLFEFMGSINTGVILGPAMLLLFSASLVFPNTSAGLLHPFPHITGIASALFYSTRLLGGAIFSGWIALMPHDTQMPMGFAFIISAVLSWVIFYVTVLSKERGQVSN